MDDSNLSMIVFLVGAGMVSLGLSWLWIGTSSRMAGPHRKLQATGVLMVVVALAGMFLYANYT